LKEAARKTGRWKEDKRLKSDQHQTDTEQEEI
jgi:hypothetical protein